MVDDTVTPPVTAAFNSEAGLAVLNYWDELLNQEKVYELGFEDGFGGNGFKAGKVAICFNGPWALKSLDESGNLLRCTGTARGPGGASAIMGGFGLAIPSKGKSDAAWDFIKWWTTQPENGVEFAKLSANLPANKNAAADDYFMNDEILSVFSRTMLYATTRMPVPGYSDVEGLALCAAGSVCGRNALPRRGSGQRLRNRAIRFWQSGFQVSCRLRFHRNKGDKNDGKLKRCIKPGQEALERCYWDEEAIL